MKAKGVAEVSALVASSEFITWHDKFTVLKRRGHELWGRRGELLTQINMLTFKADFEQNEADETLFRAGELEDMSAESHAEFSRIENESFETLSAFEEQRARSTEALGALHRAEKLVEDVRQQAADVRATLEARRNDVGAPRKSNVVQELETEVNQLMAEADGLGVNADRARAKFEQEEGRRDELWRDVEETWINSFRASMARAEYAYDARYTRTTAEQLFQRVASDRDRIVALQGELENCEAESVEVDEELSAHRNRGERHFDGAILGDFVYWPLNDDVRSAICVPLIDDADHLNLQVEALHLYLVERSSGLDHLEPVTAGDTSDDDPRLDTFFLEGRPSA